MMFRLFPLIPASFYFFLPAMIQAIQAEGQAADGSFRVYSSLDTNALLIGQQTSFSLSAEIPAGNSVRWPDLKDTITSHLEIVEKTKVDTAWTSDRSRQILSQRFTVTSFDSGFHVIPPFAFLLNNDSNLRSETEPLLLYVQTLQVDTTQAIKDIKKPLGLPLSLAEILPYIAAALAAMAVLWVIFRYFIRRKRKVIAPEIVRPKDPPHEIALRKMKELEEKKLWQKNEVKLYYSELTYIIREYIENKYGIIAVELPTDEILEATRPLPLEPEIYNRLKQLLVLADLVKFAKANPLPSEHALSMEHGYSFVQSTMPVPELNKQNTENKIQNSEEEIQVKGDKTLILNNKS